jgi:hypothetical protein
MSKFSDLLKQTCGPLGIVLEQEEGLESPEAPAIETPQTTPQEASELPIVSNDDIRKLATALQVFYSKDNPELATDVVNEIRGIGPVVDDATAKAVVDTLSKLLSPTNVDTNPQKVQNSDFAK